MAAMAISLGGARVVFLGAGTPVNELVRGAAETRSRAVLLSAAEGSERKSLVRDVKALLKALPAKVPVVVGGRGFEPPPKGVLAPGGLRELEEWARRLG